MKTWAQLEAEIRRETNTEGEDFYQDAELLAWCNDAIDEAAAEIVGLYDKYLETEGYLALTTGSSEVELPADIYANKITGIYYMNGDLQYEIKPMKRRGEMLGVGLNDCYRYRVLNGTEGRKIKLYPESRETSTTNVVINYVRNPGDIALGTDTIDIPIADNFIKRWIKDRMMEKEVGIQEWPTGAVLNEKRIMVEALNNMIPDENDEIGMDLSFYEEFDQDYYY